MLKGKSRHNELEHGLDGERLAAAASARAYNSGSSGYASMQQAEEVNKTPMLIVSSSTTTSPIDKSNDNSKAENSQQGFVQFTKLFIAGGVAGAVAKSAIAPLERAKIIFQTTPVRFSLSAVGQEIVAIVKQEGFTALWKGHTASLSRVVPYSAIQFTAYDFAKERLIKPGEKDLQPLMRIVAGGFAGGLSAFCTYPLDLLRARMAVQRDVFQVNGALRTSYREVIRSDGILGLYKGLIPTMIGIIPYSGLAFGSFG